MPRKGKRPITEGDLAGSHMFKKALAFSGLTYADFAELWTLRYPESPINEQTVKGKGTYKDFPVNWLALLVRWNREQGRELPLELPPDDQ